MRDYDPSDPELDGDWKVAAVILAILLATAIAIFVR